MFNVVARFGCKVSKFLTWFANNRVFLQPKNKQAMPQYPDIFYHNPFVETAQPVDTLCVVDTIVCDNVVPSFITSGFNGTITPLPRMTYEIVHGGNLAILGFMLLLIVLNRQLYPRQFRQILSVSGGVAHTNQLLREWSPTRSFLCNSFTLGYIMMMALFVQKSCVILSRDIVLYNTPRMYGITCGFVAGWVLLRYLILHFVNWLFAGRDTIDRQMTVQFSMSILTLIAMIPMMLLVLYNPTPIFVWVGVGLLGISTLFRFIVEMIETRVSTKTPLFYIFLYLCALEIAPFVILIVVGVRYFGQGSVF